MTKTLEHGRVGFDPLAYDLIAILDERPPEHSNAADAELEIGERFRFERGWASSGISDEGWALINARTESGRACDHCGKSLSRIRFVAYAVHRGSGDVVAFGHTCGADLGYTDRFELAKAHARRAALTAKQTAERNRKRDEWNAANPEQAAALDIYVELFAADTELEADRFLSDLVRARETYGALTESQTYWPTTALLNWLDANERRVARAAEKTARLENAPELADGRRELSGVVASAKWQDSDFGGAFKMLVVLDDGNSVWGTVPAALEIEDTPANLPGTRVSFTATVERSADDEHFGFYKRPTGARRLETEGDAR